LVLALEICYLSSQLFLRGTGNDEHQSGVDVAEGCQGRIAAESSYLWTEPTFCAGRMFEISWAGPSSNQLTGLCKQKLTGEDKDKNATFKA
jgi:hypothetical protein